MLDYIKVKNLFGTFSYTVSFNIDNGVTIIHGPNGSGKSTILKMTSSLSDKEFKIFFEVPYDKVTFSINNSELSIEKFDNGNSLRLIKNQNEFLLNKTEYNREDCYSRDSINRELHKLGAIRVASNTYEYNNEKYRGEELYQLLVGKKEEIEYPSWLNSILDNLNVRYISTNRLYTLHDNNTSKNVTKVESYQENLMEIFQEYETRYGIVSRTLDDSFPNRIIELANSHAEVTQNEDVLTKRLSKLSTLKSEFTERGILVQKDTEKFLTRDISSDEIKDNETLKKFLQLFIEDNEKKFEIFDTLICNIKSFENIFERVFNGKKVKVSKENGFNVIMTEGTMKGDSIPVKSLSSGEQHYLVLFYELIFNTKKNELILIDEPEISLHVSWQIGMVEQFLEIASNNGAKFIIATHSPSIMRNHRNLSIEVGYPNV